MEIETAEAGGGGLFIALKLFSVLLLVLINGERRAESFRLPAIEWGATWERLLDSSSEDSTQAGERPSHARDEVAVDALSVVVLRCHR